MKKISLLIVVLVLAFALTACAAGEDRQPEQNEPPQADVPAVPETDIPAAPEADAPAMPEVNVPAVPEEGGVPQTPEADGETGMPAEKLEELSGLMDQLVAGVTEELTVSTMEITTDMYEYCGIPDVEGVYAVTSMSLIGSIAHEVILVEVPDGTDAADFAAQMETLINPLKWVCVQPESKWVRSSGRYVVSVMSDAELSDLIASNFDKVFGT